MTDLKCDYCRLPASCYLKFPNGFYIKRCVDHRVGRHGPGMVKSVSRQEYEIAMVMEVCINVGDATRVVFNE